MQTVYCPACKVPIEPKDRFCKSCGGAQSPRVAPVALPATPPVTLPIAPSFPVGPVMSGPLRCPACGSENVQKVSGLFQAGAWSSNSQGTFGGVIATGNGHLTPFAGGAATKEQGASGLARLLAPPPAPQYTMSFLTGCVIVLAVGTPLSWLYQVFLDGADPPWRTQPSTSFFLWLPYLCGLSAAALAFPTWTLTQARRAQHQAATEQWRQRMGNWNALYYCGRCDRAYDPRSGQSAPASEAVSLLA